MTAKKSPAAAKPRLPVVTQISAGGVAYKRAAGKILVAIVSVGEQKRWQLPKGLVEKGETPESAAIRETREESGIEGDLRSRIETIEYWYAGLHEGQKVRYHKFVHFFLLEYKSGEVTDHDWEVNESRWVPLEDAIGMLAFKSEKEILERARKSLSS